MFYITSENTSNIGDARRKNRAYCIMRIDKRRRPAVYNLQFEANRTHDDDRDFARSNINRELTAFNTHLVKAENWNKAATAVALRVC